MPGMMPQQPEGRNYYEYEEQKDDALCLSAIRKALPYVVRIRAKEPTTEVFAYDVTGLITAIRSLGKYSLMEARLSNFGGITVTRFGVNEVGIAFDHVMLPFDVEEVPYKAELGYFVGDADSHDGGERSVSEELEESDVVDLRRHLALTG